MEQRIRIAGLTIVLRYNDASLHRPLPEVVQRFAAEGDDSADLLLIVDQMPDALPPPGRLLFDSGGVWRAYDDDGAYRIDCSSEVFGDAPYKVAFIERDFRRGRLLIRSDVFEPGMHALDYPIDEVLLSHLLGRGHGVELHGCGVIDRDGRGQLFVGQSGAGKTTTARIWLADGDYDIVSDDRVIVRAEEGEWRMFGTPWHGEAELSSPSVAPLAAIHLLVQAPRTELVSLPPAVAAARLFGCAFPPFYDGAAVAYTLETLDRLVAGVPVRALHFTPDRSVLDCIRP